MTALSRTPGYEEVVRAALDGHDARLRVAIPGRVQRYDAAKRLADVQPLIDPLRTDDDGNIVAEPLPVLPDVPVLFPGGGGFSMTFPVSGGDDVLLVFSDQSLDRWKDEGGENAPEEWQPHGLWNAVAIPGLQDFAHATAADGDNAMFGNPTGARVEATPGGEVVVNGGAKTVVADGDAVAPSADMGTWMAAVGTATGATPPPSLASSIGTVTAGARKVKV